MEEQRPRLRLLLASLAALLTNFEDADFTDVWKYTGLNSVIIILPKSLFLPLAIP